MGTSKVIYGGRTLIDLTNDDIKADKLLKGIKAHNSNGEQITGRAVFGGGTENDIYNVNAVGSLSVDFERFIITIVAVQNVDKTVEEIVTAVHNGKTVYLHIDVSESYKENAGIPSETELVGIAHFPLVYSSSAPEVIFCAMNDFTGTGNPIITRIGVDSKNNWICTSVPIFQQS